MRDGLIGIVATMLLGLGLASTVPAGQAPDAQPPEQQAQQGGDAAAPPRPTATLAVITPDAIDCHLVRRDATCTASLTIRPTAAAIGRRLRLVPVLAMPDGTPVSALRVEMTCSGCQADTITIPASPAVAVRAMLHLPDAWRSTRHPRVASGVIGLVPVDGTTSLFDGAPKRLRLLSPSPSEWQTAVFGVPGLLALIVALALVVQLRAAKVLLSARMGAPSWKAAESWAANLTVGAGLVNGIVALGVITDFTVYMTKPAYGVVSALLAGLVLLAPIVYGLARRKVTVTETGKPAAEEFEGLVGIVIVSAALVLLASGGQLLTFSLLILEVWRTGALSGAVAGAIVLLALAVLVGLFVYGYSSTLDAALKARKPGPPAKARAGREVLPATDRAPQWTLP